VTVDWLGLRDAIDAFLLADLRRATASLRLSFHSGGTFIASTGVGGTQCPVDLTSGANRGLEVVVPGLSALAAQYGASLGDTFTLAGVRAVTAMQGPTIPWRAGRVDLPCMTAPDAEDVLPDAMGDGFSGAVTAEGTGPRVPSFAPASIRAKFARMGLSDVDTVALMGAHTVGHCHNQRSGFLGAWTKQPFLFTNEVSAGVARCASVLLAEQC
jgi:cytochrome c peroxidase